MVVWHNVSRLRTTALVGGGALRRRTPGPSGSAERERGPTGQLRHAGERHPEQAPAVHHEGRPLEAHAAVPGDRRRQPKPADGHPSRNSGEPGYKASADYVAQVMRDAGYDVTIQQYAFTYYAYTGIPAFSQTSPTPHDYVLNDEWGPGQSTGTVTGGTVQPAGGIVLPPTTTPTSASGCTAGDFSGFVAGRIALVQRGSCNFGVKVLNAQAAGAAGVVIFNEGNTDPDRTGLLIGSLLDAADNPFIPTIPVAFTTFAVGQSLYTQAQQSPPVLSLSIPAVVKPNTPDYNVIAESKGGDKNHVVVVDAHLDAIYGAGMLDNASGSATILDVAQQMKNVNPLNKLRFIWFGGEELGLLGSAYYVNNLTSNELSHIGYDLDADVTATPNYTIGVLDPAGPDLFTGTVSSTFPNRVYKASTVARDQAIAYFDSIGKNHELFSPVGTDAFSFNAVGIPASGLPDRAGLLQEPAPGRPVRWLPRQLRGQRPELRRRLRRQPLPLVRQPEQQRSERPHVHVEGVRHDGGPDGLRHEGDVRQRQHGLQEEAADRRGSRSTVRRQVTG